jgi:hypothetical protein
MNQTARNTKDARESTTDFCLPWRTWRLGGSIYDLSSGERADRSTDEVLLYFGLI